MPSPKAGAQITQISIGECSLSDKSKTYSVIRDEEDGIVSIDCTSQIDAIAFHNLIRDALLVHTNYMGFIPTSPFHNSINYGSAS